MKARGGLRPLVLSAAMGALALVLPLAFHAVGLGSEFLPMLLPLLVAGFLLPPGWALATGLAIPWVSALATGMPPLHPPIVLLVSVEGAVLGVVASLIDRRGRGPFWVALVAAVIAGRAVMFALAWTLARWYALPPLFATAALLVQGIPGVVLQLVVTPVVVKTLRKRGGVLFGDE
jgi:hypothetical protein